MSVEVRESSVVDSWALRCGLSLLLGPQSQKTFLILSQGCEPDD